MAVDAARSAIALRGGRSGSCIVIARVAGARLARPSRPMMVFAIRTSSSPRESRSALRRRRVWRAASARPVGRRSRSKVAVGRARLISWLQALTILAFSGLKPMCSSASVSSGWILPMACRGSGRRPVLGCRCPETTKAPHGPLASNLSVSRLSWWGRSGTIRRRKSPPARHYQEYPRGDWRRPCVDFRGLSPSGR